MPHVNPESVALRETDFVDDTIIMPSGRPFYRRAESMYATDRISHYPAQCAACDHPARYVGFTQAGEPYLYCRRHFLDLERRYGRWWSRMWGHRSPRMFSFGANASPGTHFADQEA